MHSRSSMLMPVISGSTFSPSLSAAAKSRLTSGHTSYMSRVISLAAQHMTRSRRTSMTLEDIKWAMSMVDGNSAGEGLVGFRCRIGEWGWKKVKTNIEGETVWAQKGREIRKLERVILTPFPEVFEIGVCKGGVVMNDRQDKAKNSSSERLVKLIDCYLTGGKVVQVLRLLPTVENVNGLYPGFLKLLIRRLHEMITALCVRSRTPETDKSKILSPGVAIQDSMRVAIIMNSLKCLHAMFLNPSPYVDAFVEPPLPAVLSSIVAPCLAVRSDVRRQGVDVLRLLRKRMKQDTERRTVRTLVKAIVQGNPGGVQGAVMGLAAMGDDVVSEILQPLECGARWSVEVRKSKRAKLESLDCWEMCDVFI